MVALKSELFDWITRNYESSLIGKNRVVPALYYSFVYWFPSVPNGSRWRVVESDRMLVKLKSGNEQLLLQRHYASVLMMEERRWGAWYLPRRFSLQGKTVMDVGAGNGETASFFFRNGASKVVCIEKDREAARLLFYNARANGWNVQIIQSAFEPRLLSVPHDFLKMDCEGGEEGLLDSSVKSLKPCRIEIHLEPKKCKALIEKFKLHSINGKDVWGKDESESSSDERLSENSGLMVPIHAHAKCNIATFFSSFFFYLIRRRLNWFTHEWVLPATRLSLCSLECSSTAHLESDAVH